MSSDQSDSAPVLSLSRRAVAFGGVAAAAGLIWYGPGWVRERIGRTFLFEPLDTPEGFRRIGAAGATSSGANPLLGLQEARPAVDENALAAVRRDLCGALFGPEPIPRGTVPVASFSDYYCPYCRVLTQELAGLEEELQGRIRVAWHEWPIFGEGSETAAKAALAAAEQGAYVAFHKRMMRSGFVPTPRYVQDLAADIGLDADRLLVDMESAGIAAALVESRALARIFGFPGTPALIVGRTLVVGSIDRATLLALVEVEWQEGAPPGCSVQT
jgi:protein-disulfide isomerase